MIHIEPSDRLLIIYIALSGITYVGLLTNNAFGVYLGLMLFVVFTTYVLSWYLLTNLTLIYSRLVFVQDSVELARGASISLSVGVISKVPVRLPATLTLLHPPHVTSERRDVLINGGYGSVEITARWIGDVRVVGGIVSVREPMGLMTIERLLLGSGVDITVIPARRSRVTSTGASGYGETGVSMEGRLGDFRSLINYDYERPASTIHWMTTARVGELMMIRRSDLGSCPTIVLNSSSRMLMPRDGDRPIDEALQFISDVAQECPEVRVILVSRGYVEQRVVTRGAVPSLERDIRMRIVRSNPSIVIVNVPRHFRRYVSDDLALSLAYVGSVVDDEPAKAELDRVYSMISSGERVTMLGIEGSVR